MPGILRNAVRQCRHFLFRTLKRLHKLLLFVQEHACDSQSSVFGTRLSQQLEQLLIVERFYRRADIYELKHCLLLAVQRCSHRLRLWKESVQRPHDLILILVGGGQEPEAAAGRKPRGVYPDRLWYGEDKLRVLSRKATGKRREPAQVPEQLPQRWGKLDRPNVFCHLRFETHIG